MKLHKGIILVSLVLFFCPGYVSAQVAEQDSLALAALYNSTDGPNWYNNTNWLTAAPVSTWFGVAISGNHVDSLQLNENNLTGVIPPEIGNLTQLRILFLEKNKLTGAIPPEIGNLKNLIYLYLHFNQLTGEIPPEICNMTNLYYLRLHNNQLTGVIPPEIGNLTHLRTLYLGFNQLTGTIPSEIGNLINLTKFGLHYSQFTGAIPPEICNLTHLNILYLENNHFTDLPNLSSLKSLEWVAIQNNKLTFKDIEPNIGISDYFSYEPQDSVGEYQNRTIKQGENFILSVKVGGAHSMYQWFKDGNLIDNANDSTYAVESANIADAGVYHCEITNSVATALTLCSRPIIVNLQKVHTPAFNPAPGTYATSQSVTLSCETPGAMIRYTTNGGEPTESSTAYSVAIPVSATTVIKAKAYLSGWEASDTASGAYIIEKTITVVTPNGGEHWNAGTNQIITWSSTSDMSVCIEYTLDGTNWRIINPSVSASSGAYSWDIPVDAATTTCKIRITNVSDSTFTDTSDDYFSIWKQLLPPSNLKATDVPNDQGHRLQLTWTASPSEQEGTVSWYRIFRSRSSTFAAPIPLTQFTVLDSLIFYEQHYTILIDSMSVGKTEFIDPFVPINSTPYYYWIQAVGITGVSKPVRTEWNTSITEVAEETPLSFRIAPPFPNPFNPATNIQFDVPVASEVTLKVFNIQGQEVATLADRLFYSPGKYTLQFNASHLAAGVYFCRMTADSYFDVRRMVFMK